MTEADSGSDDDSGQVTTPVENPSNPSNPDSGSTNPETPKATYTVTFDANGGTGEMNQQTAESGTEIELPESTFTKEGYIFAGWATSADGDVSYSDKAKITVTGNITLYAKWGMTAAAAIDEIKNFKSSEEHTVTVAGTITADDLTAIKEAINGNANKPKIILDLGGTTGLTEIPSMAFYNCYLISVNIPNGVTSIDYGAFADCYRLTSVAIPNSVTSIGENAFSTSGLASVIIPNSVTSIGKYAFSHCTSLTSVTISESITSIGESVFEYCPLLTSVTIPDSVTSIGDSAFSLCGSLTSVTIPNSVTSIGDSAFSLCESLTSVNIPDSVTSIGMSAFYGCSKLTSVTVPDGVASLDGTFSGCSGLTTVTTPKSITSIGFATFYQCGSLTTVNYKGSKEDWDKITIEPTYNDDLLNAALICMGSDPKEVYTPADKAAAAIATLEGGTWANPNVYTIKITDKTLTAEQLKEIGTAIDTRTTNWCGSISLDLSSATELTEIPDNAFRQSYLSGLILPDSLEAIGMAAFQNNEFEEIVIPDNVKTIEDGGFMGCSSLKIITLPARLVSIGASAFAGCASLKTVNYKGTQAQWAQIKIDNYNEKLTGAKIICTDGDYTGE
ncbi:MAG: leucine-rich repeat protein [Spirochaetales bacterium]|nr:leucine-rich repeat protein [Spirochaetales bacterium]